jgi:hypothetical protein
MAQLDMIAESSYLGPEEADAFDELVKAGGRIPVAAFERNHGTVRQMGPGRLEREEPWLDPVSPAEALWYRGFLFRAFDESEDGGLVEYYYLPSDLMAKFPNQLEIRNSPEGEALSKLPPMPEPADYVEASSAAIDDLVAILAAAQLSPIRESDLGTLAPYWLDPLVDRASLLFTLSWELQLLRLTDHGARPARQAVQWLKLSREQQLRQLVDAWSSSAWNELCHTPGLICEGSGWQNDPLLPRTTLLEVLPRDLSWYLLSDLIDLLKRDSPDFQRPDGNYDTWYLRDGTTGQYLTGFSSWNLVEGRLIRFLVSGPMSWLGLTEVALVGDSTALQYRLTSRALAWLSDQEPEAEEVAVPIVVGDDSSILVPFNANRYHRFQIARIAQPLPVAPGKPFCYRLTPHSLERAKEQGIDPSRVLKFLVESSGRPVPKSAVRGIERWADRGTEGRLEEVVILRVRDQEILDKLRDNPKTRPFIAETLGDLAAVILTGKWPQLRKAAAQLGLLLDSDVQTPQVKIQSDK